MTNAEAAPSELSQTQSPAEGTQQTQTSSPGSDVQSIFKPGGVQHGQTQQSDAAKTGTGQQTQQAATQQQQTTQQTQQSASPTIDPTALAKSIVQAQTLAQQQMKQQVAPEMTNEEFNRKYGVRQITAQDVQAILDADPNKAAAHLNQLLDAKVRQAVLMAQGVVSQDIEGIRGQLTPLQALRQEQVENTLMSDFKTLHPDLKDEDVLIKTFAQAYVARGQNFGGDKKLAFDTVAKDVRDQIARLRGAGGGQGTQTPPQATNTQQRQSSRTMAAVQTGGRAGSGPAKQANDIELIFGRKQ